MVFTAARLDLLGIKVARLPMGFRPMFVAAGLLASETDAGAAGRQAPLPACDEYDGGAMLLEVRLTRMKAISSSLV